MTKPWVLSYPLSASEDSGQTGRMPRLIWVFAGRILILFVLSCRGSFISTLPGTMVVGWRFPPNLREWKSLTLGVEAGGTALWWASWLVRKVMWLVLIWQKDRYSHMNLGNFKQLYYTILFFYSHMIGNCNSFVFKIFLSLTIHTISTDKTI